MKSKIAMAISGGIDSLMAAKILKDQGADLFGLHFISGYEKITGDISVSAVMEQIAGQLGIQIYIVDCRQAFREKVVDYFVQTYDRGQTPNPCLVCNPLIKFGTLLDTAIQKGADFLATGHYARIKKDAGGRYHLHKGADTHKDQSYFLSFLSQAQLSRAVFPLGAYQKKTVKEMAKAKGLSPVSDGESQDICFIPDNNYGAFLESQPGFTSLPGDIENMQGKKVGTHNGLHLFTIGQRRGINCPAEAPYYVFDIDTRRNVLTVGFKNEVQETTCRVSDINWINRPKGETVDIYTRLRYRQKEIKATLSIVNDTEAVLETDEPTFPITPGQGACFYMNDEIIGAGFIQKNEQL